MENCYDNFRGSHGKIVSWQLKKKIWKLVAFRALNFSSSQVSPVVLLRANFCTLYRQLSVSIPIIFRIANFLKSQILDWTEKWTVEYHI